MKLNQNKPNTISAGQIKKKLVFTKIIRKWYSQDYIYEMWFGLKKPWSH